MVLRQIWRHLDTWSYYVHFGNLFQNFQKIMMKYFLCKSSTTSYCVARVQIVMIQRQTLSNCHLITVIESTTTSLYTEGKLGMFYHDKSQLLTKTLTILIPILLWNGYHRAWIFSVCQSILWLYIIRVMEINLTYICLWFDAYGIIRIA